GEYGGENKGGGPYRFDWRSTSLETKGEFSATGTE
ncbi:unnamed protein product, partial [marine sediment metagenome]